METESSRHSFLIRFWAEERSKDGLTLWRGHITHVGTGRRQYMCGVEQIESFIRKVLEENGTDFRVDPSAERT